MNADHEKNLEQTIDALLENVFWAWNYFFALEGLHEEYNRFPDSFECVPSLTTCLWHALFDALFAKSGQLIDRTKNVRSLYYLFKLIRRYRPDDTEMLRQVKEHEKTVECQLDTITKRINNWRNQAIAHQNVNGLTASFFEENRIALSEFKIFLKQLDDLIQCYSQTILNRTNDTITGALQQKKDVHTLFHRLVGEFRATTEDHR